jgi:hypothetical protein
MHWARTAQSADSLGTCLLPEAVTLVQGRDVTVGLAEGDSEPDFPLGGFPAGIFDECKDGPTGPSA